MSVYMATNDRSRKVAQIRANPHVTVYYADHGKAAGYVTIIGHAELISDGNEILERKRAYWDQSFPGLKSIVLIKVVPERLEVLDYKGKILVDRETFRTPSVEFPAPKARP